jgi:hypothetical protein
MLYQFLEAIQDGEVQSLLEIARSMDISPDMASQIAKELTKKGYLQEIGTDCGSPQTACLDCPVSKDCHGIARHWFLTEKGMAAISKQTTNE